MPTIRTWTGSTPRIVETKLIRDTGTGLICEDARGVRYFAPTRDVLETDTARGDLFADL